MKITKKQPLRPRGRSEDKRQSTKNVIRDAYINGPQKEVQIIPAKRDMEIDTAHGDAALKKRGKGSPEEIFGYDEKIPGESARKGALSGRRPERRLRGACLGASRKRQPFIPAPPSGNYSNPAP